MMTNVRHMMIRVIDFCVVWINTEFIKVIVKWRTMKVFESSVNKKAITLRSYRSRRQSMENRENRTRERKTKFVMWKSILRSVVQVFSPFRTIRRPHNTFQPMLKLILLTWITMKWWRFWITIILVCHIHLHLCNKLRYFFTFQKDFRMRLKHNQQALTHHVNFHVPNYLFFPCKHLQFPRNFHKISSS